MNKTDYKEAILDPWIHENVGMNDFIGKPPSWIVRSGISLIALITVILLCMSYFIRYPDKIEAMGVLTSRNPPIEILSTTNGYIDHVGVTESEQVDKEKAMFYIHNTANSSHIDSLMAWMAQYEAVTNIDSLQGLTIPSSLDLGSLQGDYSALVLTYNELLLTLRNGMVNQQLAAINREISKTRDLSVAQGSENTLFLEEIALKQKDLQRNTTLLEEGVVSQLDVENRKTELIQKRRQQAMMKNTIIQNDIRTSQLTLEKIRLATDRKDIIDKYSFSIAGHIARIKAARQAWQETYTIRSPLSGSVALLPETKVHKPVRAGQLLAYILPADDDQRYLSISCPMLNQGKVTPKQKVLIRFNAYPYKEYGTVISTVDHISPLPETKEDKAAYYEVITYLPDSIMTDYGKHLVCRPNMTAQAIIITEDRSLLERIFSQFLSLVKKQNI